MNILFIILCAIIGFAASALIILISNKISNKRIACALCCLLGIAVAIGITLLMIYSGKAASLGAIV